MAVPDQQREQWARRHGFTLMEALVTISMISVLVSLITPGVISVRSAARKVECINHLKNLALAAENHETTSRTLTLENGTGSWCRQLFPGLDLAAPDRSLNSTDPDVVTSARTATPQVFRCPVDTAHDGVPAGLTCVASTGYIRNGYWWDPSDLSHTPDACVSFSPAGPISKTLSSGAVFQSTRTGRRLQPVYGDGRSHTLLLSENVQAGSWMSRYTGDIAFGVDVTLDRNNGHTLELNASVIVGSNGAVTPSMINAGLDTAMTGRTPRPSSYHGGGVEVAVADGSVHVLSQTMSQDVDFRLLASHGVLHGQQIVSDSQY